MTPSDPGTDPDARSWRERILDAARFGEHVAPPLVWGTDLAHRAILLAIVAAVTGLFVAVLSTPPIAIAGRTVQVLADKFDVEIGEAELPNIAQRSVVVDRNGKVLGTLAGEENRIIVPLEDVPQIAQDAVLSVEDAKFYDHHGVDLEGLFRATVLNFRSGAVRQGGSTITQQLVKNTLVGSEQSLERKIKEAKLAVELEKTMSKEEILELYLNEVYFGRGVYGIGTAAEYYFGKGVKKLNLNQSALLAGIIKAPETYEPIGNADLARARRTTVLRRMLDEGVITSAQFENADAKPLGAKRHPLPPPRTPYFVEYVKLRILEDERFGATREERARALFQGGLRIETTLDLKLQKEAQEASDDVLDQDGDPASALVSIDPKTGQIVSMVGGRDFEESKFNLAVQATRQPGSTFKPVVMMAALEAGIAPSQTFDTPSPLRIREADGDLYKVANYDGRSRGFISMREATELSVNTYYVQLIDMIGADKVVDMGHRLGVTTELQPFLSLSLGTIAVSPLEVASVYATIANDGVRCTPYGITRVLDASGNSVIRQEPECERAVDKDVTALGIDILRGVIERGTGRTNGQIGRPAGGKTGTTDDYTDAWFAGFTPQYATVVWLGFPESTTRSLYNIHGLPRVYGGSLPAMIWNRFMTAAHSGLPIEGFPSPGKVEQVKVPNLVGLPYGEARDTLERKGFSVKKETIEHHAARGTVVSTSPDGGTKVKPGIVVTVQVSDGSVVLKQCEDGKDNDGDGKVDGDDPGCKDASDDDEADPPPKKQCADGKDNDKDGKTDLDDPGCKNKNDDDESDDPEPSPSPSPTPSDTG